MAAIYLAIIRMLFSLPGCASALIDYVKYWRRSGAKSPDITGVSSLFRGQQPVRSKAKAIGKIKTHERIPSRESSFCPALDRFAFQLHRHPQFGLPFPERPVRHDRPRGRRPAIAARL